MPAMKRVRDDLYSPTSHQLHRLPFDLLVHSFSVLDKFSLSHLSRTDNYFRSAALCVWSNITQLSVKGKEIDHGIGFVLSRCTTLLTLVVNDLFSSSQAISLILRFRIFVV